MINATLSDNYSKESDDDQSNRIQNMVFGQLITACYNMHGFKVDIEKIEDLIISFAKQNNLSEDQIKIINQTIYNRDNSL